MKVNGVVITGPDGREYILPAPCMDDFEAWCLMHEGEGLPAWTPPPYCYLYSDWINSQSDTLS